MVSKGPGQGWEKIMIFEFSTSVIEKLSFIDRYSLLKIIAMLNLPCIWSFKLKFVETLKKCSENALLSKKCFAVKFRNWMYLRDIVLKISEIYDFFVFSFKWVPIEGSE